MKNLNFYRLFGPFVLILALVPTGWAQQQDVPEPVFNNFSIQPPYVPSYHGRDPFKPLSNTERVPQVSIAELDYHGVILMGGQPSALLTWRGNPTVRYILKYRKLYSDGDTAVDGVVGDITETKVTLIQGDKSVTFNRF